jgi:hypothetical protein
LLKKIAASPAYYLAGSAIDAAVAVDFTAETLFGLGTDRLSNIHKP